MRRVRRSVRWSMCCCWLNLRPRYPGQLRTTAVCLRPMTLRPHENAMRCNAMQRGPGASGRAYWPVQVRGEPKGGSSVTEPERPGRSRTPLRATCKLVPTAKILPRGKTLLRGEPTTAELHPSYAYTHPVVRLTCQKLEGVERVGRIGCGTCGRADDLVYQKIEKLGVKTRKIERQFHLEE